MDCLSDWDGCRIKYHGESFCELGNILAEFRIRLTGHPYAMLPGLLEFGKIAKRFPLSRLDELRAELGEESLVCSSHVVD